MTALVALLGLVPLAFAHGIGSEVQRPLAIVVLKAGVQATAEELQAHLATRFGKWQMPDAIVFADNIPRTSVGKFQKVKLREQFANWKWES